MSIFLVVTPACFYTSRVLLLLPMRAVSEHSLKGIQDRDDIRESHPIAACFLSSLSVGFLRNCMLHCLCLVNKLVQIDLIVPSEVMVNQSIMLHLPVLICCAVITCLPSAVLHRAETIRSALEVMTVCTVIPKAQLQLCEQVRQLDSDPVPAIRFTLGFFITNLHWSHFCPRTAVMCRYIYFVI